jgi:Ca-activated chloride channel homolog
MIMLYAQKVRTGRQFFLVFILSMLAGFPQQATAQAEKRFIREGNRLYEKQQFDESELSYRRALERDDESPQARFNLGNSLYKQERYDEAMRFFGELAEDIEDPVNRSKVFHNLGNSMLMSQQIEQSIEAYKEALRNNPDDMQTRYNLAFAQHLLDEMENQEQNDDEGDEGDDQEQQEDNGDQDDNDEPGDENDQERGSDPDQEDAGQEQQPQTRPDQISPEDALRMLEAAEREEQKVQEKLMENKASEQPRTGRNW